MSISYRVLDIDLYSCYRFTQILYSMRPLFIDDNLYTSIYIIYVQYTEALLYLTHDLPKAQS